jgi:ketosteroid isomerase-like protein
MHAATAFPFVVHRLALLFRRQAAYATPQVMKTLLTLLLMSASLVFAQQTGKDEAQIWALEKSYWEDVKANDLEKYRALWHEKFVGWPSFSEAPRHKDHIADWITDNTSKGLTLASYDLEELAIQIIGDVAVVHYRVHMNWSGDTAAGTKPEATRITHTWIRHNGTWQIFGGMSAPVNAEGK